MSDPAHQLYQIEVNCIDDNWRPDNYEDMSHHGVELALDYNPDVWGACTGIEIWQALRWSVNILPRVVLALAAELRETAEQHGCWTLYRDDGPPRDAVCGLAYGNDLVDQGAVAADPGNLLPHLGVAFPSEERERWIERTHELLAEVTAADAALPAPRADHQQIVLTEPTTDPWKART